VFAIIKPGFRTLKNEILSFIRSKSFDVLLQCDIDELGTDFVEDLYFCHRKKSHYNANVEYVSSGPVTLLIIQDLNVRSTANDGDTLNAVADTACERFRAEIVDDPKNGVRARWGTDIRRNVLHASDRFEEFMREFGLLYSHGYFPQSNSWHV